MIHHNKPARGTLVLVNQYRITGRWSNAPGRTAQDISMLLFKNIKGKLLVTLLSVIVLAVSSCKSNQGSLTYFEDLTETSTTAMPKSVPLKLGPDDELYIYVTSEEPVATAPYNMVSTAVGVREDIVQQNVTPKSQTYVVDTAGNINFPQLGIIHVAGMTVEELQQYLTRRISEVVADPIVVVQLVNFRVNVLGEVLRPGPVKVTRNRYSILDALADAGDMTPYGRRDQVLLVRDNNGTQERVLLDLNSSDLLTSPYFYLQPNDYIYIRPNEIRAANARYNSENGYRLQMITTIVSVASVISSLVIALVIK